MSEFKAWGTGDPVEIPDQKNFHFPSSGEKVLLKSRPPISKTVKTD
ncbi:hypothetical protein KJ780_01200 [Candidatus Micrarchaeota archaeon]|nr:hypothetical protein [Candidatus Micrarchaeota archaeon]